MFLHVSVILFTGGGLPQCMLGYIPREQTPLKQTPPRADPPEQCMLGDTGNKRAVRILLEYILVLHITFKKINLLDRKEKVILTCDMILGIGEQLLIFWMLRDASVKIMT